MTVGPLRPVKPFYCGVSVDQIMQACHWKAHTFLPATLSSWLKQTILLCYKQADQQALDLVQVKVHDIWAFAASKAFYGGVLVDQIMQVCHWKAHNTFTNFYLKDLT